MIKNIFKCFIALTLVTTSFSHANPASTESQQLPKMLAEIEKTMPPLEQLGFSIEDENGNKVTLSNVLANKKIGKSFSVFSPGPDKNKINDVSFQLKANVEIQGTNLSIKMVDAFDESVLGRTILKVPTNENIVLENKLALNSLKAQVLASLKAGGKIANKEVKSNGSVVKLFFDMLFPKAQASNCVTHNFDGLFAGVVMLVLAIFSINWILFIMGTLNGYHETRKISTYAKEDFLGHAKVVVISFSAIFATLFPFVLVLDLENNRYCR